VLHRFVRLDDARSPGGSGLGRAIVTEIASAHGGTVRVGERAGGGALVQVELPGALGDDEWTHPDGSTAVRSDAVADPPDGFDGSETERPVCLAAQVTDANLDDVRVAVVVGVPGHRARSPSG
jgi:hypothetical protein